MADAKQSSMIRVFVEEMSDEDQNEEENEEQKVNESEEDKNDEDQKDEDEDILGNMKELQKKIKPSDKMLKQREPADLISSKLRDETVRKK